MPHARNQIKDTTRSSSEARTSSELHKRLVSVAEDMVKGYTRKKATEPPIYRPESA